MKKNRLPPEMILFIGDDEVTVRYDYDPGENQWFDARAGVGSPGYPAEAWITEINLGNGFVDPDECKGIDLDALNDQLLERICDLEAAEQGERDEAEYRAWRDDMDLLSKRDA